MIKQTQTKISLFLSILEDLQFIQEFVGFGIIGVDIFAIKSDHS